MQLWARHALRRAQGHFDHPAALVQDASRLRSGSNRAMPREAWMASSETKYLLSSAVKGRNMTCGTKWLKLTP